MIRGRLRRHGRAGDRERDEPEFVEIEPGELTGLFAAPGWLRDAGLTAWLVVGVIVLLVGIVWLLSLTQTIVMPLIAAGIIAAVASPLVGWLGSHHVPRALGAAAILVGIIVLGAAMFVVVVAGVASQSSDLSNHLNSAANEVSGWLKDIGVDPSKADSAKNGASSSISDATHALLDGLGAGIAALSSLAFFLALTALSLFFLLKDGPMIRAWGERRLGVPVPVAHVVTQRTLESLRGYFLGVTVVAAFNAVVVGLGALVLGVPLVGTIVVVTFFAAYVPYIGAWTAGAFAVLIALGGAGTDAAAGMVVVELLANGLLQQLVQPFAYGAALGIHPLAVLVVTIGGGALFGAVGLILAAPATSAIVRIAADLSSAEGEANAGEAPPARASPAPG